MRVKQEQLDFLRGIAATYVVLNHTRGGFFIGGAKLLQGQPSIGDYLSVAMLQATSLGTEMVMLFFVLSGFAMAHSIAHTTSVPRFYLKRVIRIWPPYIAATLLAFGVAHVVGVDFPLLQVIFYIHPGTKVTPQFWSLPYEVLFYALCPFVLASRTRWFLALGVAGALATVALKGVRLNPWHSFPLDFAGNEMILFAIGAMAYRFEDRLWAVNPIWLVGALPIVWGAKMAFGGSNMVSDLLMAGLAVLAIRNVPEHLPKWANFGSFSYSIYIFHFAILSLFVWATRQMGIEPTNIRNPFVWMMVVPPVVGGCFLLYLISERPCNRILAAMRSNARRTKAPEPGSTGPSLAAVGD